MIAIVRENGLCDVIFQMKNTVISLQLAQVNQGFTEKFFDHFHYCDIIYKS